MEDFFSFVHNFPLSGGQLFGIAFILLILYFIIHGTVSSVRNQKLNKELRVKELKTKEDALWTQELQLKNLSQQLAAQQRDLDFKRQREESFQNRLLQREYAFQRILEEKQQTAPWLSGLWAEYEAFRDLQRSKVLRTNAYHAKALVKELSKEKRQLIFENRQLLHQLNYDLSLFPWLAQYHELTPEDGLRAAQEAAAASDEEAAAKEESLWLAPAEYAALPEAEKYQRALERYLARPRSDWQAGRDYERYIGYLYEKAGYTVRYTGATQGLGDMGRDLIASKDGAVDIVQCKRWKVGKQIRENAIFQLVGTTAMYKKEHPSLSVRPVFVTTASLSEEAQICADYLHVTVRQNLPLADYPQIKCNVGKDGEKYYHLPFFQRYDVTMISYADGDMYCSTVQEAIDAGFIRAKRWLPDS